MEFILFVIFVALGVSHMTLRDRVSKLEHEMKARHLLSNATEQPVALDDAAQFAAKPVVPIYSQGEDPAAAVSDTLLNSRQENESSLASSFFEWLQKDFLMKVGALLLLMGFGWFVSYAFMHDWIGEAGRIMLGLLAGAGVLVLGAWRIKTYEHQGAIFTVLGSTIVLLTVSAARTLYDMFDPYSALGLMFLSILFVTVVSLRYRRNSLALAGLILAAFAPYLTNAPAMSMTDNFVYLLIVVLGTLWVVYITGWRNLTLTALIIVWTMTTPYVAIGDQMIALMWAFIFTAIFFVGNIVSLVRQRGGITSATNLYTAIGTALFLVMWVFTVAPEESQSLLFVMWMLVFSVGAYLVFRCTNALAPFYVYGATSIGLLAAATAAELDGAVLTIAFTIEIAALVLVAIKLGLKDKAIAWLCSLFLVPVLLSIGSIASPVWNTSVLHEDFFNLFILILVLFTVGLLMYEKNKLDQVQNQERHLGTGGVLITFGALYSLVLISLILNALLSDDVATMCTLFIYTVLGITLYYKGKIEDAHALRISGGMLLGYVTIHLLFIDIWEMALMGRIITFFSIGMLLLSTAFMARKQPAHELLQK